MASLVSMMDTSPVDLAASPSTEAGRTTALYESHMRYTKNGNFRKSDDKRLLQRRVEPFRMPTEVERSLRCRQQLRQLCVGGGGMATSSAAPRTQF